jgi:hypothetical protein
MPAWPHILEAVSVTAFLFYGLACLLSPALVTEFERYRLARFRVSVGLLEIAGAVGLLAGHVFAPFTWMASAGLTALMACGLWARWRIRDAWYAMLPAFALGLINLAIFLHAVLS